ncbi:alpha-glucosidase C-terminal domain-containing protein [Buttiauxella agrestis]
MVFVRVYQGERVLVAINRGEETAVNLPWEPLLNNKAWTQLEGEASFENHQLSLPEVSVSVWRCQ